MSGISDLQRDYLAEIHFLSQIVTEPDSQMVSSAILAEHFLTSQSNVGRVLERLREKDLITHQRYIGVELTELGKRVALDLLRKQGIIEAFLVRVMGLDWHEIYYEAYHIRHGVNETLLMRMWQQAGQPQRSPFGNWIGEGTTPPVPECVMVNAEDKQHYRIARIFTRETDRLIYLDALGLRPDVDVQILHKAPFDGPLQIQIGREYRIIGHQLGKLITLSPAKK